MSSLKEEVELLPSDGGQEAAREASQSSNDPCKAGSGLRLEFRKAPLETVVNYLREVAGCIIHVRSDALIERPVDLWHDQPVDTADALDLLKQVLTETGCTVLQNGRRLNIIGSEELKKNRIPLPAVD